MAKRTPPSALRSLSEAERARVLDALLGAHPDLADEAERVAASLLAGQDRQSVADEVSAQLRALNLGDLAGRSGRQWGGGYVEPWDAAYDLLEEIIAPYLADLDRRAGIGAQNAAAQIGDGLLLGLYSCRGCQDDNLVLTHAGLPDAVDGIASQVIGAMAKVGLGIDDEWLATHCPDWVGLTRGC